MVGFKIADPTKFILVAVSNSLMAFHWSAMMFSIDTSMFSGWATFRLSHHIWVPTDFSDCTYFTPLLIVLLLPLHFSGLALLIINKATNLLDSLINFRKSGSHFTSMSTDMETDLTPMS